MKKLALAAAAFVATYSGPAQAFDYWTNKPLMFMFQNSKGYWFGCGPVQCVWSGDKDANKTFGYLTQDWHGHFQQIATYGRCTVYQSNGELRGGDHTPEWVVGRLDKNC